MTAPIIAYERTVFSTEKDALDLKKEAIIGAFPDSPLLCKGFEDVQKRRWIKVVPFYKQEMVLAQFPLETVVGLDVETLQKRLAAGEFSAKS